MKPLVSICIPTYNRCNELQKTLDSIVVQPEFLDGYVEVVISDNASEDQTEKLGLEYASRYENLFYYRNDENIRDRNFPLVISRANGVLRKLNNDTFVLDKGGLGVLCRIARKYQESKPQIFLTNGRKKTFRDIKMNFRNFVVAEGFWVTWIASFAIWDTDCIDIGTDTDGCELLLWQTKKIYQLACEKNHVVSCDQKIGKSIVVPKKDVSYGLYRVFYQNFLQLVQIYERDGYLNKEDVEKIEKDLLFDYFLGWIINYEMNHLDMHYSETENLKEAVFNAYKGKAYWKEFYRTYKSRLAKQKIKNYLQTIRKNWFGGRSN